MPNVGTFSPPATVRIRSIALYIRLLSVLGYSLADIKRYFRLHDDDDVKNLITRAYVS